MERKRKGGIIKRMYKSEARVVRLRERPTQRWKEDVLKRNTESPRTDKVGIQ